ncbi:MAG: Ig domain-containing protein [Mycoplasma sp.]|nr:Ig domain-containing protein [Mycoplasma sp.]
MINKKLKLLNLISIFALCNAIIWSITLISTGCGSKIKVTNVSLNKTSKYLSPGESYKLEYTIFPENATNQSVTWTSSNPLKVKVNNNGVIYGYNLGESIITVTTKDSHKKATCVVNVVREVIHVTSVRLDVTSMNLQLDNTIKLKSEITPITATDTKVIWSSSNPFIATVDNDGLIIPHDRGVTTITVTTNDGDYTATCDVKVYGFKLESCMIVTTNENSTIKFQSYWQDHDLEVPNLSYSIDDGETWNEMKLNQTINIPSNTSIYLKGNNPNGWTRFNIENLTWLKFGKLLIEGNVSISGSIMGLLDGGTMLIDAIPFDFCFYQLFESSTGISSISEEFLPSINLTNFCYYQMFEDCTSLTNAPDLPATELVNNCYSNMFYNCKSLSSIKLNYEGNYDNYYFSNWVNGVAETGTFYYKGPSTVEEFGFPSGWEKV